MRERLEELRGEGLAAVESASTEADLRAIEVGLLGRKGDITAALKSLGKLPAEERPLMGQLANEVKAAIQASLDAKRATLDAAALEAELSGAGFDPTLPGPGLPGGGQHPISAITRELEDLFLSMGFRIADGPEVELEANNFDALNIPSDHPARESHDTIWITPEEARKGDGSGVVLRTHTSPVQVRALREYGAPLRVVAPGRVFRQETLDATHEHTFHQMEGLVVDKGVGVGHMLHAMNTLIEGVMGRKLETRLRPGFFPFVEPGFELDARCPFCQSGCSVCKGSRWIELMPGGLVHPHVLESAGVDPNEYSGFAFGLGLSRIVMLRYGIDDIRWFMSGSLDFLRQFPA
ncbi:MAG: phenylalanine--tRNA ligase subunit alpha [Planctomycetes bacterium]|nr:phenylalanine--tRNA ligase subunit alpha [Planctomycetota bacterium]